MKKTLFMKKIAVFSMLSFVVASSLVYACGGGGMGSKESSSSGDPAPGENGQ